jgi:tetratricopeptide (TPR) repeat protein
MVQSGNSFLFSNHYELATNAYSRALALQPDFAAALLNRAIAQFRGGQLDGAKRDYEEILRRFSATNWQAFYGLGEIAYRQKNWRAAQEDYESYLRYAPANSHEANLVRSRLQEVRKP